MAQAALKRSAAEAALAYIEPRLMSKTVVGVGTGSTANFFIDALAEVKHKFDAAVASSEASAERLRGHDVPVIDLNAAPSVAVLRGRGRRGGSESLPDQGRRRRLDPGEDTGRFGGRVRLHRR